MGILTQLKGKSKYFSISTELYQIVSGNISAKLTTALNLYNIKKTNNSFNQYRFESRNGDAWSNDYPGNPAIRAELELRTPVPLVYGVPIFISFWQKLNCPAESGRNHCINGQMHAGFDRAPVFYFNTNTSGQLEIRTIKQTDEFNWQDVIQFVDNIGNDGNKHHYVIRMLLHTNGNSTGNGELDVWRDGIQILNLRNMPFGYLNDTNPYFKIGNYIKPDTMQNTCISEYSNIIGPTLNDLTYLVSSPQIQNL